MLCWYSSGCVTHPEKSPEQSYFFRPESTSILVPTPHFWRPFQIPRIGTWENQSWKQKSIDQTLGHQKTYVKTCVPCRAFLTGGNVVTSSVPCNYKMWILRISELRWRCKISESCVQFLRVDSRSPCSLVDTYRRDAVRSCLANMDLSNWATETAWQLPYHKIWVNYNDLTATSLES